MPETRPGSRAHAIVQVTAVLADRLGRGVEVGEIRAEFERETGTPAPSSFTSEVHSLKRRGVFDVVGGRANHTLLAPAGFKPDRRHRDDDEVVVVLKALRSAFGRHQRPVSTREVDEEIDRLGLAFDPDTPNTVRQHLHTLCRTTTRGPKAARAAAARKLRVEGPSGQPTSHWLPAAAPGGRGATAASRSKAAAIRLAVGQVERALGRPVKRAEIRWWLDGPGTNDPVAAGLSARQVGRRLGKTWEWDRRAGGSDGRLHRVVTPITCHGGAAARWALGPPGRTASRLCHLEDLVVTLRPAEESESIRRLEGRARALDSSGLSRLAGVRRELLAAALREPLEGSDAITELTALRDALRTTRRWVTSRPEGVPVEMRDRDRQLDAAHAVLRFTPAGQPPSHRIAGQAGTATWDELDPALRATSERLGLDPRKSSRLVDRARRFPLQEAPGEERFGGAGDHPLSVLDRPDAMSELFELFRLPRTTALMRDARLCLGHVLRDGDYLRDILADTEPGDVATRRALIVALGLIGGPPELEAAVPAPDDIESTEAWLLSVVLGRWLDAGPDVRRADRRAAGAARRITDKALGRLEGTFPWSVIE